MRCANCGTELLAGKKFCHGCGTRLELRCVRCNAALDPSFRFCPDCGSAIGADPPARPAAGGDDRLTRLARSIPEPLTRKILESKGSVAGERKLVTVFFCDLVGSTAIAERLDPEEYRDLLDQYLELAFREIYRFEGIVNQLAGDGMMALFGAPIAHEDAPHRAIAAALAVRDELARFNENGAGRVDLVLRARIGIHTGPVVVGTVGNDLKMDYSAIGDTTNLAARLQSLAAPGTILVSEATHRLVRGAFEAIPAGPFDVKGKSAPVSAFEILGATEAVTPMALAEARGMTPFVGRDEEMALLVTAFDRLAGELPQIVSVVGEAGSGKSRLLYEFQQRLAGTEVSFFEARCSSMTQALPYAPFIGMLRQYLGLSTAEPTSSALARIAAKVEPLGEAFAPLVPFLLRLLSLPADGVADVPAEEIKRQTFEAIAHLVIAASLERPVVIFMEDLQCIDEGSRELLELAVAKVRRVRLMIVVTHRPEYEPAWRSQAAFTQLNLRRLPEADGVAMIRSISGGELPSEIERMIVAKAEGNPFFTEELTRALLEEGTLVRGERQIRLTRPVEQVRIPGTVEELIAARLDRLGASAKRVAQVASVFGRQFRRDHLARLLHDEEVDVAAALEELERRGVIHRKHLLSGDEFRFGEGLTQEVAYESLLLKARRQLHERIAALLQSEPGEITADRSALVAQHLARGDDPEKAVAALLRAGADAERLPSYRAAGEFFRKAWEIADARLAEDAAPSESLRRLAVSAALGLSRIVVVYAAPTSADPERAASRGLELARALGDLESVAGFHSYLGMIQMASGRERFAIGLALVEEGLAIAQRHELVLPAISISRALAWSYLVDGRFDLAERSSDWVLAELERLGHRARLADIYFGALWIRNAIRLFRDDLGGAADGLLESYELAVRASNRTSQSGSSAVLAQVLLARGRTAEAREWAERAIGIAEVIGNAGTLRSAAAVSLMAALELGEPVETARYLELIEQGIANPGNLPFYIRSIVEPLLALGETRRAERYAEQCFALAGGQLAEAISASVLADVKKDLGASHWEEAGRLYRNVIPVGHSLGSRSTVAFASLGAAELALAAGERSEATRLAEAALPLFRELGLGRYEKRAERLLAELAASLQLRA